MVWSIFDTCKYCPVVNTMMSANNRMRFGLQIFVCLYSTPSHYHHWANLSEDIELIKCLSDIFCQVCKIKHILSVIQYTICGAVCFQITHFPCDDWENIYTWPYYHHRIGRMNYYPLFRVRSWNNGVHCMSFYILMPALNILLAWSSEMSKYRWVSARKNIDGLVQERRNSRVWAMEICHSYTNQSIKQSDKWITCSSCLDDCIFDTTLLLLNCINFGGVNGTFR